MEQQTPSHPSARVTMLAAGLTRALALIVGVHRVDKSRSPSENANSEIGILTECPKLAREVIRVIGIGELKNTYRPTFAADGHAPEWLTTDDQGEVLLREEPEVTPFMRLRNRLLDQFVPERLL